MLAWHLGRAGCRAMPWQRPHLAQPSERPGVLREAWRPAEGTQPGTAVQGTVLFLAPRASSRPCTLSPKEPEQVNHEPPNL